MGAKEKVLAVITDPALTNISFTLGNVRVIGREFSKLLPEIRKNTLGVGIDPKIKTPANYDPTRHVIRLKSNSVGNDVGSKAAIAHECTHAYLSSQNPSKVTGEIAGYLVEVLFALAKNEKLARASINLNPVVKPATCGEAAIGQQALALIDKKGMDKRSVFLGPRDYAALGQAILSVPLYQGK